MTPMPQACRAKRWGKRSGETISPRGGRVWILIAHRAPQLFQRLVIAPSPAQHERDVVRRHVRVAHELQIPGGVR
jgi:hypothetical protein